MEYNAFVNNQPYAKCSKSFGDDCLQNAEMSILND